MSEDKQNKKSLRPDVLKWTIIGLIGFIVVILIFSMGMRVGGLKAKYSYRWAESYHRNFAGPKTGFFGNWQSFPRGDLIEGHGAFGEIIEVNDSGFILKGRGNVEKIIIIDENTVIKKGRESMEGGMQISDSVVIVGSPNEAGQIEAKFIRVFNGEIKKTYKRSRFHFFK